MKNKCKHYLILSYKITYSDSGKISLQVIICVAFWMTGQRNKKALLILCCFDETSKWFNHSEFLLTLWLQSSGGRTLTQLQTKALVAVRWLTDCMAEPWLAAETSWSVSTSPRQSGDCDTLHNQCYQSVPTICRTIVDGEFNVSV